MKRPAAVISPVIALCVLMCLPGCGGTGDVNQARALVRQGDANVEKLLGKADAKGAEAEPFVDSLQSVERVLTYYSEVLRYPDTGPVIAPKSGIIVDPNSKVVLDPVDDLGAVDRSAQHLKDFAGNADRWKDPFKKVLKMEGVEDYKQYAEYRLDMLDQAGKAATVANEAAAKAHALVATALRHKNKTAAEELEGLKRKLITIEEVFTYAEEDAEKLGKELGLPAGK